MKTLSEKIKETKGDISHLKCDYAKDHKLKEILGSECTYAGGCRQRYDWTGVSYCYYDAQEHHRLANKRRQ